MSLGYLMIILSQPLILMAPTAITFSWRKRIYIVYTFLICFAFNLGTELLGPELQRSRLWFLFFCSMELTLPYLFGRFFLNDLTWKSAVFYEIIALFINLFSTNIIRIIPVTRHDFFKYLEYKGRDVSIAGGLLIFFIFQFVAFAISYVFRKLLTSSNQSHEKIYMTVYFIYMVIALISAVTTKSGKIDIDEGMSLFFYYLLPVIILINIVIIIIALTVHQKRHVANIYKGIVLQKKEDRGDSNKQFRIFEDGSVLNDYFTQRISKYKKQGVAVDIISYLPERISAPVGEEEFIKEMDKVFAEYEENRKAEGLRWCRAGGKAEGLSWRKAGGKAEGQKWCRTGGKAKGRKSSDDKRDKPLRGKNTADGTDVRIGSYLVISFKMNKNGIIIHLEYDHISNWNFFTKLFEREYVSFMNDYYKFEKQSLMTNEVLLMYPYSKAAQKVKIS